MLIRLFLVGIISLVVLEVAYTWITHVSFNDQKAHISKLYCRLLNEDAHLQTPIIFIPGLKGSLLSQSNQKIWLSPWQVLKNTKPLLYKVDEPTVHPIGILTRIAFLPGLIEYAPYQKISAALACNPNAYFFSYDWRKNPIDSVPLLDSLVDRVILETGQKPSIIAHSMGGLVTHLFLKAQADKINKVVYVSTPFKPGVGFIPDLQTGSGIGFNKTLLSKEAVFSQPSSFALLPHAGERVYKNQDLMEIATWKTNKISVFQTDDSLEPELTKRIREALVFQKALNTPALLANKFLFVVGNCHDTLQTIQPDDTETYLPGDGSVPEASAYPVEKDRLDSETFVSCVRHDVQLNDPEIIKKIVTFLKSST